MILKLLSVAAAAMVMAASASAQAPADLHKRLTGLRQIDIKPGLTRITNAEGDGRDAQVFSAWRANGNAWGFGVFIVSMPTKFEPDKFPWNIVGIETDTHDLDVEVTDQPHTGEDDLRVVRFARGKLDGGVNTFLITATRNPDGPVTDAVSTEIRIYALRNHEDEGVGTTADTFDPVFTYMTVKKYSDADDALHEELGLPLPRYG